MSNRIERLIAAMTLDEKIGQLNMIDASAPPDGPEALAEGIRTGTIGSILNVVGKDETDAFQRMALESRLRIPLLVTYDVIHGERTIFPVPLAEAGAFDETLWTETARAAAEEAVRDGVALTFAPMLDVSREPRWGRIVEGPGEDPLVASRFGAAKVTGFTGKDLADRDSIASTAKHYCAYGAVTAGRDYAAVDISERQLEEVYLPPFEAAVRAGAVAIMPAFNDIGGVPMTAHAGLLRSRLRDSWGFDGVTISDYNAVAELQAHGIAADLAEAAAAALNGGNDIDMQAQAYLKGLGEALARGLVQMATIDEAVRRVLRLKERLGLFDDPFARAQSRPSARTAADLQALSREAARRSIVLLQNRGALLPLGPHVKRIALIGPLADAPLDMLGPWFAQASTEGCWSVRAGLAEALPDVEIVTVEGVSATGDDIGGIDAAMTAARTADLVILCLGEPKTLAGEATSRAKLDLPGRQRSLAEAVLDVGRPTVAVLVHGRPLALPWLFERVDAALATWYLGQQHGRAVADVLTGACDATGRLAVTWPADVGQVPIFHAQRPSGRPGQPDNHFSSRWLDVQIGPQFPFGHGVSYARFEIDDVAAEPATPMPGESVRVAARVRNVGARAGEETLFLFLRDPVAAVARPVLELRGWARIALAPGMSGDVSFVLEPDAFAYLDADMMPRIDAGTVEIFIGPSAAPARLKRTSVVLQRTTGA